MLGISMMKPARNLIASSKPIIACSRNSRNEVNTRTQQDCATYMCYTLQSEYNGQVQHASEGPNPGPGSQPASSVLLPFEFIIMQQKLMSSAQLHCVRLCVRLRQKEVHA